MPEQTTQVAEWRQEDPGVVPAGDVYGGGSPTGIAFYENGIMEDRSADTLLVVNPLAMFFSVIIQSRGS